MLAFRFPGIRMLIVRRTYKELEGKKPVVDQIHGRNKAMEVIKACIDAYIERFGDGSKYY